MAAGGQLGWPRPGRIVAGYGQIPMSVVTYATSHATVVDVDGPAVAASQCPEVGHHAVLPQEPVVWAGYPALANYLRAVVDVEGVAADPPRLPISVILPSWPTGQHGIWPRGEIIGLSFQ